MSTSISRRSFLALAGTVPFAARLAAAGSKVPVGLELYTVRDALAKDLMGTVRAVAKLGFEVVEFYSPYFDWTPQTAKDVRTLLDDLNVRCLSTHNGGNAFTPDGLKKAIELNKTIGSKYIVMAHPGEVSGIDGYKKVAETLNAAADTLAPLGMSAGYHNPGAEWHQVGGQRPIDVLAANTKKSVVLQFDVGTCVEAGADPVAWINANPGRIKSIHCKEWAAGEKGYAALFGEGNAPWAKIFEAAEKTGGVEFYLIEQEAGPADQQLQRAEQCLANYRKLRA
jgi:sugar phosphate isomerase/epimerase